MITRRSFILASSTLAAIPFQKSRSSTSDVDVVIIGAGAAGLSAAKKLSLAGKTFILVEANNRIGGRAYTDANSFSQPIDQGCSWLLYGDKNPCWSVAESKGFSLLEHSNANEIVYSNSEEISNIEYANYNSSWGGVVDVLSQLTGDNVGLNQKLFDSDTTDTWIRHCLNWIGPMSYGVDIQNMSFQDWNQLEDESSRHLVKEGYGNLVSQFGAQIDVNLSTTVSQIHWSGSGVRVDTSKGSISAKTCIITTSTGVLAANKIRFSPELPHWKQTAINALPMGMLLKIPLLFDSTRFGIPPNTWISDIDHAAEPMFFLMWPFDYNYVLGFAGGSFGWNLTESSKSDIAATALARLKSIFGNQIDRTYNRHGLHLWGKDPNTLGAYAHPLPGMYNQRKEYSYPVADKLYFAGEACADMHAMTCHGALFSGERVATQVINSLN